jgi:hypothetical protein
MSGKLFQNPNLWDLPGINLPTYLPTFMPLSALQSELEVARLLTSSWLPHKDFILTLHRSADPRYHACLPHDTILNTITSCVTAFVYPAD